MYTTKNERYINTLTCTFITFIQINYTWLILVYLVADIFSSSPAKIVDIISPYSTASLTAFASQAFSRASPIVWISTVTDRFNFLFIHLNPPAFLSPATRSRCPSICLFIRLSVAFENVTSFATWRHLADSGGFMYRVRYRNTNLVTLALCY